MMHQSIPVFRARVMELNLALTSCACALEGVTTEQALTLTRECLTKLESLRAAIVFNDSN